MYHVYIKKVNDDIRLFGQFNGSKAEINQLVSYWNFIYPNRNIETVE